MSDCENGCAPLPKGLRGPRGFQGEKGDQGKKGDRGITGAQGPQGNPGNNGLKGDTGLKGDKGEKGDKGDQGSPGLPGSNGISGTNGIQGIQGVQGEVGPKGEDGLNGNTVQSVYSSAIGDCGGYKLNTLSGDDGTIISSYDVYNGCNGKSGRGVAVFVQATQPTDANVAANYSGINGFTAPDYIVAGSYDASKVRAGDIWIKP